MIGLLEPCRLADVLRITKGAKNPPTTIVAGGVACLSSSFLRRHHLALNQVVRLQIESKGEHYDCGRNNDISRHFGESLHIDRENDESYSRFNEIGVVLARLWPMESVSDGFIAVDDCTLESLCQEPSRIISFDELSLLSRRVQSLSKAEKRVKPRPGKTPRTSPCRTLNTDNRLSDSLAGQRGLRGDKDLDCNAERIPVNVSLSIVRDDDGSVDDAQYVRVVALDPDCRSNALLRTEEYVAYLTRVMLHRIVATGTMFSVSLGGIQTRLAINQVSSSLQAPFVVMTDQTYIDVEDDRQKESMYAKESVGNEAESAFQTFVDFQSKSAEPLLADIGGLESEINSVLELAQNALETERSHSIEDRSSEKRSICIRPRGVLLHGSPGSGKTLVARAVAKACNARLEVLNGPQVVGARAGESEVALRALFQRAYRRRPCVIVLDEVDAIATRRDDKNVGPAERRLTSSLVDLMDGGSKFFGHETHRGTSESGIFVVGTTNRPDMIDPALRRAGRFDREIEVPTPSVSARLDILSKLTKKARLHQALAVSSDEMAEVARVAFGYVGADLAAVWREAVSIALQRMSNPRGERETNKCGDVMVVNTEDLRAALRRIKPSALREVEVEVPTVRWSDVGGMTEVKQRLREAIELPLSVHGAKLFAKIGISPPRGLLLFGPPGCSKTLLAKAVASESGANFISIKGPELLSKWVGESEKAVRATFRRARSSAPCVVFFDEIDALASSRGSGGSAHSRVVAQLLTEMDGIGSDVCLTTDRSRSKSGIEYTGSRTEENRVVVIAATNRPDLLDSALLRPGRLGVQLYVGLPDEESRIKILQVHTCRTPLAPDVDIRLLACDGGRTDGMSGAELAAVVREAALAAMEEDVHNAREVHAKHFNKALGRVRPRTSPAMLEFFRNYIQGTRNVLAS